MLFAARGPIAKMWTRWCPNANYCWRAYTTDAKVMQWLVHGEWGEKDYFQTFFIAVRNTSSGARDAAVTIAHADAARDAVANSVSRRNIWQTARANQTAASPFCTWGAK